MERAYWAFVGLARLGAGFSSSEDVTAAFEARARFTAALLPFFLAGLCSVTKVADSIVDFGWVCSSFSFSLLGDGCDASGTPGVDGLD